ncbi:hypothetical protein NDU88_003417 [Pleurodeles waltl]|uniref:Uncharacterized protein n=1 Tax=Pleurodeles waltl TaxID=8319 RepID=A0AAV7UYE4_PLEWA|nr:hypothetical protein NDU88_003417 [Pleurodeles waltl]
MQVSGEAGPWVTRLLSVFDGCWAEPGETLVWLGGASRAAAVVALVLRVVVRASRARAKDRVTLLGGSGTPAAVCFFFVCGRDGVRSHRKARVLLRMGKTGT